LVFPFALLIGSYEPAVALLCATAAFPLSIEEFRKFTAREQAFFITGAVSMIAYNYAAGRDTARARCIQA